MTTTALPLLRPLGLGELLDQAIRLYRRNFLTFIGIIAIVQIPLTLVQLPVSLLTFSGFSQFQDPTAPPPSDPSELLGPTFAVGMAGSLLVGIIGFILLQGVATAVLTRAIADSYLGQTVDIIGAYRKIGGTWVRLILAFLLAIVIGLLLLVWLLVPCIGWLTGIGVLAFFSGVITPLIAPAVVLEGQAASRAWRRAWDLARRRFWWVVGFVAILYLFAQLVVSGPTTLVGVLMGLLAGDYFAADNFSAFFSWRMIIQSLVALVFRLVYLPLQLTSITLMYFDLRVRTEGFDLTLLAASAPGSQGEVAQLTAQAPLPQHRGLITGKELGYFALLSLIAFVGLGVLWFIAFGLGMAFLMASGF